MFSIMRTTALLGVVMQITLTLAHPSIGTVPKSPTTPHKTSSTSGSGTSSFGSVPAAKSSVADENTISHAVEIYNSLVTVIRDVVTKAKLTPIGETGGVGYIESCSEHKFKKTKGDETKSGVYTIWPTGKVLDGSKQVWCDMETDGGGWTVVQRRGYSSPRDKAEKFDRLWREYKLGFGSALGDYWLGLQWISAMGARCTNELEILLTYFDETTKSARYSNLTLGPETDNYRLYLSGFLTGAAGDVFEKKHNGLQFHTSDKETVDKCAAESKSGWWFVDKKNNKNYCAYVDLNAELKNSATDEGGMTWRYHSLLKGWSAPAIKMAEMMIRPKCPPGH